MPKKDFLLRTDTDLLESLSIEAKRRRTSKTAILTEFLLTLQAGQKEVMGDGVERDEGTKQPVSAAIVSDGKRT